MPIFQRTARTKTPTVGMRPALSGAAHAEQEPLRVPAPPSPHSLLDTVPVSRPRPSGQPLPARVQARMERTLGADFSAVRIHEGPRATEMGALAFTQGTDLHFAPGQYNPHSPDGLEMIGHELTHVLQQKQGRVRARTQLRGVGLNEDSSLEHEADTLGARAARGEATRSPQASAPLRPSAPSAPVVQRVRKKQRATLDEFQKGTADPKAPRFKSTQNAFKKLQSGIVKGSNLLASDLASGRLAVSHSRLRFARAHQRANKTSTKNIGTSKYRNPKTGKVIYVVSTSMGMGATRMIFKSGHKYSHSEAVLRQINKILKLKLGNKVIDLKDFKLVYSTSTNAACRDHPGQQNCAHKHVPKLTGNGATFQHANPYGGSDDANTFQKMVNAHEALRLGTDDYESDPESEDEDDVEGVYNVDTTQLEGAQMTNVNAIPVRDMKKSSKRRDKS
jgi:hypothetical protein